jgi:hypothetical protein
MVNVNLLIGAIVTILLFAITLLIIKMWGEKGLEPAVQSSDTKDFPKYTLGDTTVEARILFKDRPKENANQACCFIFYALLVSQFLLGIVFISMSTVTIIGSGSCPKGTVAMIDDPGYNGPNECISQSMADEYAASGCRRRLSEEPSDFAEAGDTEIYGRFLLTHDGSGSKAVTYRHDLWSAMAMMHNSQMNKLNDLAEWLVEDSDDRRLFGHVSEAHKKTLWQRFEEFVEIPAVLLAVMLLLVPTWLFVLKKCTGPVVWSTLGLDLAALVWLVVRMDYAIPMIVVTVLFILLVVYFRKKIKMAIEMLHLSTEALSQNPSVFAANMMLFFMYIFYVAFWEIAIISSTGIRMQGFGCRFEAPGYLNGALNFMIIMFLPTTFFFLNAKLVVCACGLGSWYFHDEDPQKPKSPSFVGLKWAFFDCAGPTFTAAIIQYIVHEIRKVATRACWFSDPIGCAFRLVWCFLEGVLRAFTKFMLLGHIFTGGALITTAKTTYVTLKNHLGDAIATDMISHQVVQWSTCIFSVGLGFSGWAWMDQAIYDSSGGAVKGLFKSLPEMMGGQGGADIVIVLLCLVLLYFSKYPLFTLVVFIGLLQQYITTQIPESVGFFTAIFLSSICSIVFMFVGGVVHNSTDTMMYCVAIERETGKQQERFKETYAALEKHGVVQGVPASAAPVAVGALVGGDEQPKMAESQWPADNQMQA